MLLDYHSAFYAQSGVELAATVAAQSSVTATATVTRPLAAAVAAESSLTAVATVTSNGCSIL